MTKDTLFTSPGSGDRPFRFDDRVADVFEDMIGRSVPGYADSLETIRGLAGACVPAGGRCYDLGCSLGAATRAICVGMGETAGEIVAVDNSAAMIARCRDDAAFRGLPQDIHFVEQDLAETAIEGADLVVMNYTLQFVPPAQRRPLLARIHDGMRPGGVLVVSEKFRFEDPGVQALMTRLHLDFKRRNGYSEMEIAGKRSALENVLIADTRERHASRLEDVGFQGVTLWQAHLNFGTYVAFRRGD